MLGSINTGGFSKSQVDAMKDSNYFNRKGVKGVYDPVDPNAPVVTGSAPNFLQSFLGKMPKLGTDGQGKTFLDRYKSYRPEEESGQDKFYGALAQKLEPIQFRYKKEFDPEQKLRAGFSAQQVQKIIPEAVVEEDGILMLDMDVLQKYMREAKRELRAKNS